MKNYKLIISPLVVVSFAIAFCFPSGIMAQSIIISDSILLDVKYLSSPELAGRLPGTQGYDLASEYCESIFKNYEVQSFDSLNGYKQLVPVEKNKNNWPLRFCLICSHKGKQRLKHGENYNFRVLLQWKEGIIGFFCGLG
jgi:hypothetical protein